MWLALGDTKVIPQRYLGEALVKLVLFVGSLLVFLQIILVLFLRYYAGLVDGSL